MHLEETAVMRIRYSGYEFLVAPVTFRRVLPMVLAVCCGLALTAGFDSPVDAAKKKAKKVSDEEVKAAVEPVQKTVLALMGKIQTRLLFTPADNGKLEDLRWQMMDLMAQYGKSNVLVQPVYQAAVLFERRNYYQDAYDMYQFLETNYPEDPMAPKAAFLRQKLEKRFGPDTFGNPQVAMAGGAPGAPVKK